MRPRFVLTYALCLLLLLSPILPTGKAIAAGVKPGATCKKLGQKSIASNKQYSCIKSSNKLVWSKGVALILPTPVVKNDYANTFSTDQDYFIDFIGGPCQLDTELTGQLAQIQQYFYSFNSCAGQMRLAKYSLGAKRPLTTYSPSTSFSDTKSCKLVTPGNAQGNLGFTTDSAGRNSYADVRRHPSPNSVIQLIPIYAEDTAAVKNTPSGDYKVFLDYVKSWIEYSSDFGSKVKVQIPDRYIKFPGKISTYGLFHENNHNTPSHLKFNSDVVAAVDSEIDFTGVNFAIIVPPAGTDASVLGQAALNTLNTAEGSVGFALSQYAAFAANPLSSKFTNLSHPFWWIHESFHAGFGFDDHYGDSQRNISTEYGMGWLTMMTPWGGDLTVWEKWILGFMQDSQIQCLSNPTTTTHWIAPATVQSQESKAVIIPISPSRVIVVESRRAAGLNYKDPKSSQGVMVYEIDLTKTGHGLGMKLILPTNRIPSSYPFFMADYPLKLNESATVDGIQIKVIESGTYGDVVRITKG